ncbi:nucleoside/nucleotide kinase family protein [Acetobacter conturbans]|uniref:Nucleoside triphosphate hydrolase n=1 Tax=Acetobacter conturbans TaxID=1737472 RepID=A0ABX0JWJ5_9PROT|nr:nucleoside triphosphate hydrolase [Acetobacter conturbans]NHN87782.1 nucleoside triphosphate hydrolase [Acetobacter conturbans]
MTPRGPIIALVGADGSGKTTTGSALLSWMRQDRPVEFCHLGKQTGNWGRAIARLPLMGSRMDRRIVQTTDKARTSGKTRFFPALIIFILSMRRVIRFRRMLKLNRQGLAILTDRYPQVVVPGPMDGPGLVFSEENSGVVQALACLERGLYAWMASYRPDLVIRLNVDLQTAIARKPDHRRASLERKIADVPQIDFGGAPILDLDATEPSATVISKAEAAIADVLQRHDSQKLEPSCSC